MNASMIYARLIELSIPFTLRLHSGEASDAYHGCFWGPTDALAAAAALANDFSRDELVESGVCVEEGDGALRLADRFVRKAERPIVALRDAAEKPPLALLTEDDSAPALLATLSDYATRQLLKRHNGILCLARTVADVAALRVIGLPAAPIKGLSTWGEADLQRVAAQLNQVAHKLGTDPPPAVKSEPNFYLSGSHAQVDAEVAAAKRSGDQELLDEIAGRRAYAGQRLPLEIILILNGWSHFGWSEADEEALRDDCSHIAKLERARPHITPLAAVWRPTESEYADIHFATQFGSLESYRAAIWQSLENSTYSPARFVAGTCGENWRSTDYLAARSALVEANHDAGPDDVDERWSAYAQAVQKSFVAPLEAEAMASDDPLHRSLLAALAAQNQKVFALSPAICAQLPRSLRKGLPPQLTAMLREQDRGVNNILRLAAALKKRAP